MLISESNLWPCRTHYKWDGYLTVWRADNGKIGVLWMVGYLHTSRVVISGKMLSYLIGVWKTDGKSRLTNLTAFLAEIWQHGPAQVTLDEEDSRECEGGRSWERYWDVICIQATFQGAVSFPSPCLCFRGLLDTKALSRHLHEIFNRYWPVSRNMSVASSPPCLAPMASQRKRGVGHVKWHSLFSLSGKDPSYWNGSS